MKQKLPAGTAVLVICIAVFILRWFVPLENTAEGAILCGAYYKPMILAGEWWRMLTCGFVHADFMHLAANGFSLLMLSQALSQVLGRKKFYVILIASILGGSLCVFAVSGNIIAMGLSGGLYGLMACYTWLLIRARAFRNPAVRRQVIPMYAVNLLINFLPGVSAAGHIGGFVTGFMLSGILAVPQEESRKHFVICSVLLVVVTGFFCMRNAYIPKDTRYLLSDLHVLGQEKKMGLENHAYRIAERLDDVYETDGWMVNALKEY